MRRLVVIAAVASGSLVIPFQVSAARSAGTVVCPQDTTLFSGAADELVVPAGGYCEVHGATVGRVVVEDEAGLDIFDSVVAGDVVLGRAAGTGMSGVAIGHDLLGSRSNELHLERTTIGHNLTAWAPITVQTGKNGPDAQGGTVRVGHDLTVTGTPEGEAFVFDGLCQLAVGHDVRFSDRMPTLGLGIGGSCHFSGQPGNTIAHDLVVTGVTALSGFFGPSSLEIGANRVGHDLIFRGNHAEPGGRLDVFDNVVEHDALCANNTPAVSGGANTAGHTDTCG